MSGKLDGKPEALEEPLEDYVDRALWSGDANFVPPRIEPHDDVIRSEYTGSSQKSWADTLRPLRVEAEKAQIKVKDDIADAFP